MSSDAQTTRDDAVEAAMLARIEAGEMFEDIDELSPRYREILRQTAEIASISEVSVEEVRNWRMPSSSRTRDTVSPARRWA